MKSLVTARLRAQRLSGAPFKTAVDAVRWFGAVQSQDYPGAKWALGLRVKGATDAHIDRAYNKGAILRTHVLRPTWHFVVPEDLRWMLALTGPRIRQGMAGRYRRLELDEGTVTRAQAAFGNALSGGRHLTRVELADALRTAGIAPDGQRLPHLISWGELGGLLTSGRLRGKQVTWALLEERVPRARVLDRDEAIGELTRRYFVSHGPAQLRDFVWWSGLTLAEARRGVELAGDALDHHAIDGKEYWFDAALPAARVTAVAHLLPNFDEYSVGYTDRSAMLHPAHPFRPELFAFSSILANVVTVAGQVVGAWRRVTGRTGLRVEVRPLARLTARERVAVEGAGVRLSRFLERTVEVDWMAS
jgi:winged helix DNA-binding protein